MPAICPNRDNARSKLEVNAAFAMTGTAPLPPLRDEVRALALNFAPPAQRPGLHALWALDEALGQIVRTTTEPMIGQMRLTWWHDRLSGLGEGAPPAEPVLAALAGVMPEQGVALAAMVEGWEALLDPLPLGDDAIAAHASMRGGRLFALAGQLLAEGLDARAAGEGWAAIDFALHCSEPDTAGRAQAFARQRFSGAVMPRAKPLRILTRIAAGDARRSLGTKRSRLDVFRAILF